MIVHFRTPYLSQYLLTFMADAVANSGEVLANGPCTSIWHEVPSTDLQGIQTQLCGNVIHNALDEYYSVNIA